MLLSRRILFVTGKGGTGKSTIAAAASGRLKVPVQLDQKCVSLRCPANGH